MLSLILIFIRTYFHFLNVSMIRSGFVHIDCIMTLENENSVCDPDTVCYYIIDIPVSYNYKLDLSNSLELLRMPDITFI